MIARILVAHDGSATADQASHIDPCNPRLYLIRARILRLNSMYASARRAIGIAHALDPSDIDIRMAWLGTLPLTQRIDEQILRRTAHVFGHPADGWVGIRGQVGVDKPRRYEAAAGEVDRSVQIQTARGRQQQLSGVGRQARYRRIVRGRRVGKEGIGVRVRV